MLKWSFKALAALAVLLAFAVPAFAAGAGYTITEYRVEGVWHENNTVDIREQIEVNFTERSHGIYRSIPTYFFLGEAAFGGDEPMQYETYVRNVAVSGDPFETNYDSESDRCRIRIGDADQALIGPKSYDLSFTYVIPEDRLDGFDFLYYSVLGAEWETSIDHFSFVMRFDKPLPRETVEQLQIVSGRYGSETNALDVVYTASAAEISGEAKDIAARRSITLFSKLPDGYFSGAKRVSPLPLYAALALFALTAAFALIRMLTGNHKPVRSVQFYPPGGISSAEVGTILDEAADEIDLFSLIPLWAQQGYLTIEKPDKRTTLLHQTGELPTDAPTYQKTLFSALFGSKSFYAATPDSGAECNLRDLGYGFYSKYKKARAELEAEFTGPRKLSEGKELAYAVTMALGFLFALIQTFNTRLQPAGDFMIALFTGACLMVWGWLRIRRRGKLSKRKTRVKFALQSLLLLFLPIINTLVLSGEPYNYFLPRPLPILLLGAEAVIVLFSGYLVKDTEYKAEAVGKLLGLKEFIRVAEAPRLQMLMDQNPQYYYDILPYAMVFGLADKWAKRFEGLSVPPPNWYGGYAYERGMPFDPYGFQRGLYHSVVTTMHQANTRAAASEISSGSASSTASSSSGGFSSGGGAGGGGGGRW